MPPLSGEPPRVAIIGVTGYASIYLLLLRDALRKKILTLNAAVIINQQEVPEIVAELRAGGTTLYEDADTFFAHETGRIALCLIPVGIQWHARLTIAALHSGMNVLVEKPLAGSLADITLIRRAEAETGRWVAVGFQDLYSPEARRLKTQLLDGIIGKIESIRMIGFWPRPRAYFTRNRWAGRIHADGAAVLDSPLNNAFAHFINLSLYFAGTTTGESADVLLDSVELHRAHCIETFDTALVNGTTPSGTRLWFGVSHATGITRDPEFYLQGTSGRIVWWHEKRYSVTDHAGQRREFSLSTSDDARLLMLDSVLRRLIEAIHQTGPAQDFPATSIDWIPESSYHSEYPSVRGLAEKMDRALHSADALPVANTEPQLSPS